MTDETRGWNMSLPTFNVTTDSLDYYRILAFLLGFFVAWLVFR